MNKPLNWFEIPALDIQRAQKFYEQILAVTLRTEMINDVKIAIFPYDRDQATGGCVAEGSGYHPSTNGVVIYLNAGETIDPVLERVGEAGGEILVPKTALPSGMGVFSHVRDTEGNRVALHAMK